MAKAKAKEVEADEGTQDSPLPWVEPFPASELDEGGKETIFVRATVTQVLIVNGIKLEPGQHTVGANFAHQHSAVLASPKE